MFIHEVEHIVGLSKKSIRYYEEHGLLSPKRDKNNDYRIYDEDDIRKLKVIKFLRELNVSIKELEDLSLGKLLLSDCMKDKIEVIEREKDKYKKIKDMCSEIIRNNDEYDSIDINNYFCDINILNKEGFTMRDVSTDKRSKIIGSIFSSGIFIFIFGFLIWIMTYFQLTETEQMPWVLFWFLIMFFVVPIIGTLYNLVVRIKEINGGEEDEASKY